MKRGNKRTAKFLDPVEFNREAHDGEHDVRVLLYTTEATLVTTAGVPLYPLRGKTMLRARVSVTTAPSGAALAADILIDGNTAFSSIDSKLQVRDGEEIGDPAYFMGGRTVDAAAMVQCKIDTISSAAGPAVFEIEYIAEAGD